MIKRLKLLAVTAIILAVTACNSNNTEEIICVADPTPEVVAEVTPEAKPVPSPTPEATPTEKPVAVQAEKAEEKKYYCTLSVRCDTVFDNMDKLSPVAVVPKNGVIFPESRVEISEGESVFDLLLRTMKGNGIHLEFSKTPVYNSAYIEGINNLYEFDLGELSGWMYRVNGEFEQRSCSEVFLKDGDIVEWLYSCDLGKDIGNIID